MKLLVFGSRGFNNYMKFENDMRSVVYYYDVSKIISGGATGADKLAEKYAEEYDIPIEIYEPNYDKYRKRAPLIRNTEMAKLADAGICFYDGESRGTMFTIKELAKLGKQVYVYGYRL